MVWQFDFPDISALRKDAYIRLIFICTHVDSDIIALSILTAEWIHS